MLELVRLGPKRDLRAGQLAHGEKQWLEIGMLLAQDPQVLLVDEPAAGMTDDETHRTGELLISLAGRHSLIVIEHDMTFVKQIAQDRKVTVLHQGSILCEGSFEEVQGNSEGPEPSIWAAGIRTDECRPAPVEPGRGRHRRLADTCAGVPPEVAVL